MVWGCIAYNQKGPLFFMPKDQRSGKDYVELVMEGPLLGFYSEMCEERGLVMVMEDGAPIHRSNVAKQFQDSYSLQTIYHPAQSPDMNPIEHIWRLLKERVNKHPQISANVKQLKEALLEEWDLIDMETINRLIESMPERVKALQEAKGGSMRY
jgi:hypothetical protein